MPAMRTLLCFFVLLAAPGLASALDFAYSERFDSGIARKLRISGRIVAGDHQKFLDFLRANPKDAVVGSSIIALESPGGDIKEAMALASTLKDLYPRIHVTGVCASSCLLLWLSGSARHLEKAGRIGIHRPSFLPEYFRGLSVKDAEKQYLTMSDGYRQFILGQGLPQSLYERLMATSSTEVHWLDPREIDLISIRPPYYDEKVKASCGRYLDNLLRHGTDGERFKICELLLPRREKAAAVTSIVGTPANADWERFRENYLKDVPLN